MITKYEVKCGCGFKAEVEYGRESESDIREVYSCKKCKNLFTLKFKEKLKCPKCKGEGLIQYNPNKQQNMDYYRKMEKAKLLDRKSMGELEHFWITIHDKECPKCRKKSLSWNAKNQKENEGKPAHAISKQDTGRRTIKKKLKKRGLRR